MKAFVILAFLALTVSAAPIEEEDSANGIRINGENGWYVPQIDGSFVWMTKEEGESLLAKLEKEESMGESNDVTDEFSTCPVSYYLYTNSNQYAAQQITDSKKSISKSNFNSKHPTRFIIHGWTQDYEAETNKIIKNAWLDNGEHNIIVIDWGRARSVDYASSVVAVPKVGKKVAGMIDYLVQNHGMSLDNTEVIGHSLGAHVAGYVGKNVENGQLHAIVGLDPALPLFSYDKPNKRLSSDDAYYVESIQTNGGKLGFLKPIGKGAFYPNGGQKQPGCGVDLTGSCSHERSCIYYAEAVRVNDFPSVRCEDYEDAVAKSCGKQYSSVKMGAVYNYELKGGKYFVPVHSSAPYGYAN